MKMTALRSLVLVGLLVFVPSASRATEVGPPADAAAKSDQEQAQKAAEWAAALRLNDAAREVRVAATIATHLKAVRDWHNAHPATAVPAGINPVTGKPLSNLDRQIIADSAMPRSVHDALLAGLRQELTGEQVAAVLDQYTVGKVAFTMNGYRAIVPDLTKDEEAKILGLLQQAREMAVDYKSMPEISAIFEIYKTQAEQFLNANGRNWKALYKAYSAAAKARKAAEAAQPTPAPSKP